MKSLILLLKITVFMSGAYLCYEDDRMENYWYVGPIFGVVVLIWQASKLKDLFQHRGSTFLIGSTFIYALVVYIIAHTDDSDFWFRVAVAPGSVLLPLAHGTIFKVERPRVILTILCLSGTAPVRCSLTILTLVPIALGSMP